MNIDLEEKIIEDIKLCISLFIIHLEERQEISKDFDTGLLSVAKDCELVLIEKFSLNYSWPILSPEREHHEK